MSSEELELGFGFGTVIEVCEVVGREFGELVPLVLERTWRI